MRERKYNVFDIKWAELNEDDLLIDGETNEIEYPSTTMEVVVTEGDVYDLNDEEEIEEYIAEYITDVTSFLHEGFNYKEIR